MSMLIFLRWGMSVIRHWVLLIGGAGVSVALLFWDRYASPEVSEIPAMVWWTGIVAGFVGACFLAWKKEWTRANTLAIKRPEFTHFYAGLEQWKKTDGSLVPDKFDVRFVFKNTSGIGADDLTSRIVIIQQFDAPPACDSGYKTAGNRIGDLWNLRSPINIVSLMPPLCFVIDVSYKDARTGAIYWQQMFYKWGGSGDGTFDMMFVTCSLEERRRMETYIATRVKPPISRTAAPSRSQDGA